MLHGRTHPRSIWGRQTVLAEAEREIQGKVEMAEVEINEQMEKDLRRVGVNMIKTHCVRFGGNKILLKLHSVK